MAINQSVFNRFASNLTCGIFVQVYIKLWNFTQIDCVTSGYHDDKNWYRFFAITFVTFVIETSNWCQNDRLSILDTLVCYSTLSVYTDFKLLRFEGSGGQTLNLHIRIKCRRGLSCPALLVQVLLVILTVKDWQGRNVRNGFYQTWKYWQYEVVGIKTLRI